MNKKKFNSFKGKTLLITGGTGSFGNAVLKKFLDSDIAEIRIFSRDEKKQHDQRKKFNSEKLSFYLGDVRDKESLLAPIKGADFIFHAAALKQVPSCEFYPLEAVKTNVLGTENVLNIALSENVKKVVCLSTDKAVYPINAMGISKAMMEKVAVSKGLLSKDTIISVTRYGNVMASRGSVIPVFLDQIINNLPITVTDKKMTRFMMTLSEAVDLVLYAFENANSGDIFVQKSPSSTIEDLAKAILSISNKDPDNYKIIGTRHGEKEYETLLSREEFSSAKSLDNYFKVSPDTRDLNYENFFTKGDIQITNADEYNSHNTSRLSIKQLKNLLLSIDIVNEKLSQIL